jgi:hypothetical protein
MENMVRVVEVRAGSMWRRIAVSETDSEIRARVDELYKHDPRKVLDVWLAIERELCPVGVGDAARVG